MRSGSSDRPTDSLSFVATEIVEDDDIALGKGGHEDFPDVDGEDSAWTNTRTARRSVLMPRSASSATSPRVVNGPPRQRWRSHSARSSGRVRRLCPPIWPGARAPVSAKRRFHFETLEGLIDSAAAIDRVPHRHSAAPLPARGGLQSKAVSSLLAYLLQQQC